MDQKRSKNQKRIVSGLLSLAMITTSMSAVLPASADAASKQEAYPYAIFAADELGGIKLDLNYLTVNGNTCTNGVYSTTAKYPNVNGTILENEALAVDEIVTDDENTTDAQDSAKAFDISRDMIYIHNKLMTSWFNNGRNFDDDYTLSEMNINLNSPVYVTGKMSYNGNMALNTAIGAVSDVTLSGGNLNGNNAVIYSKFGDINIDESQASMNGLIYAPFGTVTIYCDNFNLNGIIIAQNVVINSCYGANINYSNTWAEFVGTESEELSWTFADWKYLADTDKDGLPNIIEKEIGTKPYEADTDGDLLPDGYEVLSLGTDPLKIDTNDNGVSDYDEDFDTDGLSNGQEYEIGTRPYSSDTDGDNLKDGDEVNTYFTDPLKVDTDKDGLDDDDEIYFGTDPKDPDSDDDGELDGKERRSQTFTHKVENEDCAVTEVIVSMEGTGNLQKTTTVESVMNKDMLCTGVVGLVGEPFSIETTSDYEKATLTYVIDKSKLGDTEFDNLLFLWYDEKKDEFVELETILDEENSTVSINTTHFSKYMIVDREAWFDNWRKIYAKFESLSSDVPSVTAICVDCSGSMSTNDPSTEFEDGSEGCYRELAVTNYIKSMMPFDRTCIITFNHEANTSCPFISNKLILISNALFFNSGGTNADAAIEIALTDLSKEKGNKNIILLSDGDVNVKDTRITSAAQNSIRIHTIGLGKGADNEALKKCSRLTGGEHFTATTAKKLEEIYSDLSDTNKFDFSYLDDKDGDGVPDDIEISGIPMPNGALVFTDPNEKHSDKDPDHPTGDGLTDGEEVGTLVRQRASWYTPEEYVPYKFAFNVVSNPLEIDSDNDGIDDSIDDFPFIQVKLKNYFIAYDREGKDLYNQALWMIENEYNNQDCEIYYLHSINEFIDCWNNHIPSDVATIHLYLHGAADYEIDATLITEGHLNLYDPALQFYKEVMKPTPNDFEVLESKYVEKKVYLNACNGGTEDEYGFSVAKRISEKIYNHAPVEALKDGYVNYLSKFDYEISDSLKSPYDDITFVYANIGEPPFQTSVMVSKWKNYNLYPRRSKTGGTWIEITSEESNGYYTYNERVIGDDWKF